MKLSVLYRGPLSSCNYACAYCPFSKRRDTPRQLERDHAALARFSEWMTLQTHHEWKILFTPWGEALVRSWYRRTLAEFSHLPQVGSVTIQTNLSCGLDWLAQCRTDRLSLWATYHPTETTTEAFVRRVNLVAEQGVRISVGTVGVPEMLDEISNLREQLPRDVYLWINALQPRPRPYTEEEIGRFQAIDPQFLLTARRQPSLGKQCQTGEMSFTVDGRGDMRRCHFVDDIIGNCYEPNWEQALRPRTCPNRFCDCFLGKSQLLADKLAPFFGSTALERLPARE
ncbi:MAG: STM4011 family radical SAM protein [Planctomycetota bacterium]